jgi:DNA-binding GntR family transcriptional regulator
VKSSEIRLTKHMQRYINKILLKINWYTMKNDKVYTDIKQKIIDEEFRPGQWLVERELCDEYGISRTPLREALQRLVSEGFLSLQRSKGYLVKKLSIEEIIKIFQAREAVECMLSRLACHNGADDFIARLKELEEELEIIDIVQNSESGTVIGSKLHSLIAKTANNPILYGYFQKLKDLSALTRNISKRSVGIEKKSKDEHIALIKALINRDENNSEICMRNHLRGTCQRIVDSFISDLKGEMKYISEYL